MWHCYYCRSPLSIEVQKKNRLCPNCGSDLHCCKNCHHYDDNLNSKCKEPNSDWISDRAAQNSCSFFEFQKIGEVSVDSLEIISEAEKAKKGFPSPFSVDPFFSLPFLDNLSGSAVSLCSSTKEL